MLCAMAEAWFFLCLSGFACLACAGEPEDTSTQPPGWDDELRLAEAVDENPDPRVFETRLTAQVANLEVLPGTISPVWTYNGVLPGPLIRVSRGDRLIVHFENQLPEATTIHWHGVRVPNEMDGVPDAPLPAVEPGETFVYDFTLRDSGLYWYHPHFDSSVQVGFGLYGALLVDDPEEPADLGDELVLVVSDIDLKADGNLQDPTIGGDIATLFGREGNTLLVNGKVNPTLHARSRLRQRWRVVNAAKSRYFQLGIEGQYFTRIGADEGFIGRPEVIQNIVLTPGQRIDAVLDLDMQPQSELPVRWIPYDRGFGSTEYRPEETVFTIRTESGLGPKPRPLPALSREIPPIDVTNATKHTISLTENSGLNGFALGINGVHGSLAPPIPASLHETHVWTVRNTIDWAHPFHLHGFFFQVLDVNGVPPSVPERRDTVDVPVDAVVRLAVHFDERPGMWMFHCHILDHAEAGMMGMLHLEDQHDPEARH